MGREEVDRHNGLTSLINLMKAQLNSSQDGAPKLRMVLCGFLLNLTNTHGRGREGALRVARHRCWSCLDEYVLSF